MPARRDDEKRYSADTWLTDYLIPSIYGDGAFYGTGLQTTLGGDRAKEISATLPGYSAALRMCPPAFAAQLVRALVLSQARFTFRNLPSSRTPRRTFGTQALSVLEHPWPRASTGELLGRMEWHAGLAGNAYVVRRGGRLRVIRPDWTAIVYGSQQEPEDAAHALDGEVIGYIYENGGIFTGRNKPQTILPQDMAHWAPIPDPEHAGIGMSWITPAVREIQSDRLTTDHKIKFFEHGATPNLVVKGIKAATREKFLQIVDMLEMKHAGIANAYRTLYLTEGADATVVGSDLKQLDFKSTQGAGETRISVLSRVPASLLGIAEGLAGSSLNAGNFGMARRVFGDIWVYPTLQDAAGSLAPLVDVPRDAELWYDTTDIPLLREDAKDAAEIQQIRAITIRQLIDGGFEPVSVIAAVQAQDMSLLRHSGLLSVQLQEPGVTALPSANGKQVANQGA